jgi:hypothetical protein
MIVATGGSMKTAFDSRDHFCPDRRSAPNFHPIVQAQTRRVSAARRSEQTETMSDSYKPLKADTCQRAALGFATLGMATEADAARRFLAAS